MQHNRNDHDYFIKIATVGNPGVGKTALIHRFGTNTFHESNLCTIGLDFFSRTLDVYESIVRFQVWDLCGGEQYKTITRSHYRGALGVTMVFDVTDRKSFIGLSQFCQAVVEGASEDATIIVVGTKADLEDQRVVGTNEARDFAEEHGFLYIETSAKTGMNVDNLYLVIAKEAIEKLKNKDSKIIAIPKQSSENPKKRQLCIC